MSFVDLMANDVWSDADITRRTESMIRAEFSAEAETILNRKVSGMVLGIYAPTEAEMIEMGRYQMAVEAARIAGVEARADMVLLSAVMALEEAQRVLDNADADETAIATAAETLAAAGDEALALLDRRRAISGTEPASVTVNGTV